MTRIRSLIFSASLLLPAWTGTAADLLYEHFGRLGEAPQVNAISFINHGLIDIDTVLPFETQNTRYFTNFGVLFGSPGFRFDHVDSRGVRTSATSFLNGLDATVFATSGERFILGEEITGPSAITLESASVAVHASSIVNRGQLHADANGLVRLVGETIDLERSSVGILPFTGGFGFLTPTNFVPDVGIFDAYWGINVEGTATMDTAGVVAPIRGSTNVTARSPRHLVTNQVFINGFNASVILTNAAAFVLTNAVTPTNWLVQAVFVQKSAPQVAVDVKFTPSSIPTNSYRTAIIEFSREETNVLEGENFLNQIYLIDRMASETNYNLLTNLITLNTAMPGNYEVTRLTPLEFAGGSSGNVRSNFHSHVWNSTFTNTLVTNIYAGYAFDVTNVTATLPDIAGVSITNLPGRVEIVAKDLNANRTRIRGEGIVSISAENITSSSNLVMDVPNLAFNLSSKSGNLAIRNLSKDTVDRTTGRIFAWSAMWTNQTGFLSTNTIPNPNDPTTTTNEIATNVVDIGFHVLIVDARLRTDIPVYVANFKAKSDNVTLADTVRVVEKFEMDTGSLLVTETGQILLGDRIPDWDLAAFPRLTRFENAGTIMIPRSGNFGTEGDSRLDAFLNRGTITTYNMAVRAAEFMNSGSMEAAEAGLSGTGGTIHIAADNVKLEGGTIKAGGQIEVHANHFKLQNTQVETAQSFVLTAPGSVSDAGREQASTIKSEGFRLTSRPAAGDLLGTTFESTAPKFLAVPHVWAGEDRGPVAAGFANNAAMGRLVVEGGFDSLLTFSGAGGRNALYVDFLEIGPTLQANLTRSLLIEKSMVIYFAGSNVAADQLDGLFADAEAPLGRLRWVPEFMGPNSTVDVALQGENRTVPMNRALRESQRKDSDGDGIVNGLDEFPLEPANGAQAEVMSGNYDKATGVISFSWKARPGAKYVIEFSDAITGSVWKPLSQYENTSQEQQSAVVRDRINGATSQRFYRLRYK